MSLMSNYIDEQPELFEKALINRKEIIKDAVELFLCEEYDSIFLVASGTSKNAAESASLFLQNLLNIPIITVSSKSSGHYWSKHPLAIFISQGGASTNTIDAIKRAKNISFFALTGKKGSKVDQLCNGNSLIIPCNEENIGPKTKGYTMSILSLYLFGLEVAHKKKFIDDATYDSYIFAFSKIPSLMKKNIELSRKWIEENINDFINKSSYFMVGKKPDTAIATEGALKVMETLLIPSLAYEFEEYLHGPVCSLSEKVGGIYILPNNDEDNERILKVANYHKNKSNSVFTIASGNGSFDGHDLFLLNPQEWYLRPFTLIIPFQLISEIVPLKNDIEGIGMKRFREVDNLIETKYKE